MARALPGRPTASPGKMGGKQASKGDGWSKSNPKQPPGPPPGKAAVAKPKPRGAPGGQQQYDKGKGKGGDYAQPMNASYYGAASRRRAMTLLGQDSWQDMAAWGLKRDVKLPPPPPMKNSGKTKAKHKVEMEEPQEPEPIPEPDVPPLMRVEVPDDAPPVSEGLPAEAPIVHVSKALCATGVWSNTSTILAEMVGDIASDVQLNDDLEWTEYPQLGEAIKDNGGEESSLCVAICKSKECWGVGVGGKKKNRDTAAKLALCVALASSADQDFASKWINFMEFALQGTMPPLRSSDNDDQSWSGPPAGKKRKKASEAPEEEEEEAPPKKKKETWVEKEPLPRDAPLWITLPDDEDRPSQLADYSSDQALVVSTAGGKGGFYSQCGAALRALLPEGEKDVEFLDDPNWSNFPAVGKALKAIAEGEECMTVAVCPSLEIWAVGVGMKSKNRQAAAKAAIAVAVAVHKQEADEDMPEEFEELEQFQEFVEQAKAEKW